MTARAYSEHTTPLIALGHTVTLNTWGCKLSASDEADGIARWRAAFAQIDDHASEIPDALKALFFMLDEIIMPGDAVALGDFGKNPADGMMSAVLSLAYCRAWSSQTLAAIPGFHEMTHQKLKGVYNGSSLWLSEKAASANQLAVMKILCAPQSEIAWITWWGSDANEAGMQKHMESAFVGPPLQNAA